MRLRLVPAETNWDFFSRWRIWVGLSALLIAVGLGSFVTQGLNFGIDFRGGTTIRTESTAPIDIAAYRAAIEPLALGDVTITEVFDPNFEADQNVAMVRIGAQEGQESVSADIIRGVEARLGALTGGAATITLLASDGARVRELALPGAPIIEDIGDAIDIFYPQGLSAMERAQVDAVLSERMPLQSSEIFYSNFKIVSVESVGPKVSGELIRSAAIAVLLAIGAVLIYIWLRFEWQFAVGAVAALIHDVLLTIGVFSLLQIKFDLAIIAALLTIVGYSLNDTVVVFDRVRENLRKYKQRPLEAVLNLSINETLSRTVMTSVTTLLALISLFVLGGDVIRGFVFAMIWGVIVGTYSSVFVASTVLLSLGVARDSNDPDKKAGTRYAEIDA